MVLVPWSKSSDFRMPVTVWRETIEHYYPNTGWWRCARKRSRACSAKSCAADFRRSTRAWSGCSTRSTVN